MRSRGRDGSGDAHLSGACSERGVRGERRVSGGGFEQAAIQDISSARAGVRRGAGDGGGNEGAVRLPAGGEMGQGAGHHTGI